MTGWRHALIALGAWAALHAAAQEAPAYQDRLIDGGSLPIDSGAAADERPYDASGWPRSLKLETQLGSTRIGEQTTTARGLALQAQLDTPQYGSLSADVNYRWPNASGVYTLRQMGMPFDGGWRANNTVGMFNPGGPDLLRLQPRFVLPGALIEGAGTEWLNEGRGLSLYASSGRPGAFIGAQLPRFENLGGTQTQVGLQAGSGPWSAALAGIDARGVPTDFNATAAGNRQGWAGAVRHSQGNSTFQFNALSTDAAGSGARRGYWADIVSRDGPLTHSAGVFQFDPNLFWGSTPITSDIAGVYYRYGFRNRQWTIDGNVEMLHSPSGLQRDGGYASGSARYQYARDLSFGGGGAVRRFGATGWSAFGFIEKTTELVVNRAQLDIAHDADDSRAYQLTLDQTWAAPAGMRLSTSLAIDRQLNAFSRSSNVTAAILAGSELRGNLSLDASVRLRQSTSGPETQAVNASVGLTWRINSRWSLLATFYENRGKAPLFPVLDPLAGPPAIANLPTERSFFLVLRYEDRAGLATVPLGGRIGDASGRIAGMVYLDANENGRRDAAELPAPNVTVILDGRYATRTDGEGNFDFPLVAAGRHTLTVSTDNLPLPWTLPEGAAIEVTVSARETARAEIGAVRLK